jgi:hypothetical protein
MNFWAEKSTGGSTSQILKPLSLNPHSSSSVSAGNQSLGEWPLRKWLCMSVI